MITHLPSRRKYIGSRYGYSNIKGFYPSQDIGIRYFGSSKNIECSQKCQKSNSGDWSYEVLASFPDYLNKDLDLNQIASLAVDYESELHDEFQVNISEEFFNIRKQSDAGNFSVGMVSCKDREGKVHYVAVDDSRISSGDLSYVFKNSMKGKSVYRNKNGNTEALPIDDPLVVSGEVVHISKGTTNVIDSDGRTFSIRLDDERFLSRELVGFSTGRAVGIDSEGNRGLYEVSSDSWGVDVESIWKGKFLCANEFGDKKMLSKESYEYVSGEYTALSKGSVTAKDKEGNFFRVDKEDSRLYSGEIEFVNTGMVCMKTPEGNIIKVSTNDPRIETGELISPYKDMATYVDTFGVRYYVHNSDPRIGKTIFGLHKGNKYIHNDKLMVNKKVPSHELESYLDSGWVLGMKRSYSKKRK